jgi:hypothetical protein
MRPPVAAITGIQPDGVFHVGWDALNPPIVTLAIRRFPEALVVVHEQFVMAPPLALLPLLYTLTKARVMGCQKPLLG